MKFTSLWVHCLVLAFIVSVFAKAPVSEPEFNDDLNIEVTGGFPNNPLAEVANGMSSFVVLEVENQNNDEASIIGISGQVADLDDPSKVIRKYGLVEQNYNLPKGEKATVPFLFHSEFEAGEHELTVFLDVVLKNKHYRMRGLRTTITVKDPESSLWDFEMIFLYAMLTTVVAGVGYFVRASLFGGKPTKSTKPQKEIRQVKRNEKGEMILDASWIPKEHLKPAGQSSGRSSPNSPKTKKRGNRK